MSFIDTIIAYENSERLTKSGVKGHLVAFPQLAEFDASRRRLVKVIKDSAMHEVWDDGLKIFNTIHAKLARTPCRPSWLVNEMLTARGGSRVLEGLKRRLPSVDSGARTAFEDLCDRLDGLKYVEINPLLEEIRNVRNLEGRILFILRDFRLWEEVKNCLAEVLDGNDWEIVKPSSLRSQQRANRLFIFGPPWYIGYRNEGYLLRAPAAAEVHIIGCEHEFVGDVAHSLLGPEKNIIIHKRKHAPPTGMPWDFEPISPVQRGGFHLKGSTETRIWESGKKVTAIPFRLGGSHGTFLGKESTAWVVTADCSGSSPICSGVERIPVDELEPGGMVLLTTSGGGDMIPVVADMILRRSRQIRGLQTAWKAALLARVESDGLGIVSSHLKSLGAQKASVTNLKNWCNPRSIGMENLDTDLMAVLKLIGMEARYDDVVSGIVALRGAHQSAGAKLQKKLRESLLKSDLTEVFRQGYLEIKHGDGPAKTVFLIEERGDEADIPEEWEGELTEIED